MARALNSPGRKAALRRAQSSRYRIAKRAAGKSIRGLPASAIKDQDKLRRICFVTGTRAEFGLMQSTLAAIRNHPSLKLQVIATGMHLSARHGRTIKNLAADAIVPWAIGSTETENAIQTGRALSGIATEINRLKSDVVLVVGDRVEAFAAATAGHLAGKIVAHIHGGDRALGQVDDSLRHAITKLAHIHFPATAASRQRILKLGEDSWRVHQVGSPGIDGIVKSSSESGLKPRSFALLVLHPTDVDEAIEQRRAKLVLSCVRRAGFEKIVIVYPNNDPGSAGIIREWERLADDAIVHRDVPRAIFLGLMRDAAVLIGNSSSGIIEAASFGTPVVDVGNRQLGRERSKNCFAVPFSRPDLDSALKRIWNGGKPIRFAKQNVYGGDGAGERIAQILARVHINSALRRKLIAY